MGFLGLLSRILFFDLTHALFEISFAFLQALLQFSNALANASHQLRNLCAAKEKEDNDENDDPFRTAREPEKCVQLIHDYQDVLLTPLNQLYARKLAKAPGSPSMRQNPARQIESRSLHRKGQSDRAHAADTI